MRRRRILITLVALLAAAVLCVITLPFWLGAALRLAPERWGVRYGGYERIGYGRFALRDVDYQRANVHVTVARVEVDSPLLWLWHRGAGQARPVVAGKWSVVVGPKPANAPKPTGESGWVPLRTTLRRIADQLDRWLPRAQMGEGSVTWPGGGLTLASADWGERKLAVKHLSFRMLDADATAEFPTTDELRLMAKTVDNAGTVRLKNAVAAVDAEITWWGQRATLTGEYGPRGWLPAKATLQADDWSVPGEKLKLGASYAAVRGRTRIEWTDQALRADAEVHGDPVPDKKIPPLEATLRGHGDLQTFTVEALHATLPGITADLSAPITVDRQGKFADGPAKFAVQADLAKQPWFEARGNVQGTAELVPTAGAAPVVNFRVLARDVVAQGVSVATVDATGRFVWPRIEMTSVAIVGGAGERLVAKGGWDLRSREILGATVEGELRRATLARWVPSQPKFDSIAIKAEAAGPLATARHSGEIRAGNVVIAGVKPMTITASWSGAGAALEKVSGEAVAGETRLSLRGALDRDGAKLTALELMQHNESRLRLTQPATIQFRPALHVEGVRLAGGASAVDADVTWGETGHAAVAVRGVPSTWLADLVTLPGPTWQLLSVALTGSWDRGPMTFSAVVGAAIELGEGRRAVVNLAGRGDQAGVQLEALRAAEGAASIVNATGVIPLTFTPGAIPLVHVNETAPLQVDADTAPNAAFWSELAALTGLELKDPHASVHIKGTWRRPEGDVQLNVARLAADPKRFKRPLPTIEALRVSVVGDPTGVRLDSLSFRVEGQEMKAAGRLPIGDGDWAQAWKQPLVLARRGADLRFEVPDADVAVFARFLPTYLAPQGRLHVDVGYKGGEFAGNLRLQGAATRPLGPLGVVQDIDADVTLVGNRVNIRSVTAKSGGESVRLSGQLEIPEFKAGEPAPLPKFDVVLQGNNLPFVRRSGLLMRGDLDLKLTTPARGSPVLSGNVKLRDSLFLQDLRALRPGGTRSVSRRPPYFSIDTPPLDTWRLDLTVSGDEFMRLRTTLFNGVASANFHLGGTLAEPIAIGDATIDDGRVRLPFASFEVQEGRVTLTREQPYEPQLSVVATARRFSYDLRMEVTGSANAPILTFSSSPPLEHGQILLMVMAGEAPKSETLFSDQQRAQRLGQFIGQSLLASLTDSDSAERLSIAPGEKLSRTGRDTYQVEYKLSDRWSAVAEYDEFDEYNGGLKWRVYAKGGREDTEARKRNETDQR
jgi:translocation and assembly module TamB